MDPWILASGKKRQRGGRCLNIGVLVKCINYERSVGGKITGNMDNNGLPPFRRPDLRVQISLFSLLDV